MSNKDEIIFEQFFRYENMTIDERNFYLLLISSLREQADSNYLIYANSSKKFDIVEMHLKKKILKDSDISPKSENAVGDEVVEFNGSTSNGCENRSISGVITLKPNCYFVRSEITQYRATWDKTRIFDEDEDRKRRNFKVSEVMIVNLDGKTFTRRTLYIDRSNSDYIGTVIPAFNYLDAEIYANQKVLKMK